MNLKYLPKSELDRVRNAAEKGAHAGTYLLADMFRLNTLYMIMRAGSGHIGSSFSCLDIVTHLWLHEMTAPNRQDQDEYDIFFSSKGHDVPGLYSAMLGFGALDFELIHTLRRLGGLPGHPDIETPGIVTNTGSLGMGISKAAGMALAKRQSGKKGRIYVLTGDGELHEGQFWESLLPAANAKLSEITVIIDHNKMQSDTWVSYVSDLGDLEARLRAHGWEVARCDGHDLAAVESHLKHFRTVTDRPQVLIADTIKGRGVTFMESGAQPTSFEGFSVTDDTRYKFHSGAPSVDLYEKGVAELSDRIQSALTAAGLEGGAYESVSLPDRVPATGTQKIVAAYGEELVKLGEEREDLFVLDADLVLDCGLIPFSNKFPERFVECGIAEMDMVSRAGGLALEKKLPVVNSFACFLSTRPNEQIYNNATELTKIVYAGTMVGILPAGPGHSHQSVRDISILASCPGLTILHPATEAESRAAIRWAVQENSESTYLRLTIIPYQVPFADDKQVTLQPGRGSVVREGTDAVVFAYGPVMLSESFQAAERLAADGKQVRLINLPWINRFDADFLREATAGVSVIITVDDHYVMGGQGEMLTAELARLGLLDGKKVHATGVREIPACGTNPEVLKKHELDADGLAAFFGAAL